MDIVGEEEEKETQKDKKGQRTERTRQHIQTQTRHREQRVEFELADVQHVRNTEFVIMYFSKTYWLS